MPSLLLGSPMLSGPSQLISGNPYSGYHVTPTGGFQLRLATDASGTAFIYLSGGASMTINSGGFFLSGSLGLLDGMPLGRGDAYFVPRLAFHTSGQYNIYAHVTVAGSGQTRLYWEAY